MNSASLLFEKCHSPGDSDHSAGHHPHQVVSDGKEGSVRTAVAERNPEPLGAAQRDVDTKLPRWAQHTESQKVGGTASQRLDVERLVIKCRDDL